MEIDSTQDHGAWLDDYVTAAVADEPVGLPPKLQKIGEVEVVWLETEPGIAFISAVNGTIDDRQLAQKVVAEQLRPHGFKRAAFTLDWDKSDEGLRKEADWSAIEAKAKRLIQSGKVHILRNGATSVVGQVEGDHGNYQTEISRDDPNSEAISLWQCECLVPGTLIAMYDGSVKPVEEIVGGDVVLTATGHAGVVSKPSSRHYEGDLVGLKIEGSTETVWMTDNHKLPNPEIDFKEVKNWKAGDFTYLPEPTYPEVQEIDVAKHVSGLIEKDGWLYKPNKLFGSKRVQKASRPSSSFSPRQKPIPARIKWDCSFAFLAGLFVAEGIATPRGELRWSFNAKTEQKLADFVISNLPKYGLDNAKKSTKGNCVTVAVQSKPMADLFCSLFGTGSKTKRLSLDVLGMPQLALASFFGGWFEGDGHEGQNQRDSLATASPHLAMQARLILACCKHESVIRVTHNNSSTLVPNGTDLYVLSWRRMGGKGQGIRWHENCQIHQRMCEPERKYYSGLVHNFEVIDYHTYVISPGIASANCPWDQFAWQRTRQWKKYEGRVCAHVLATYWKSHTMPLDEEYEPGPSQPPPSAPGGAAPVVQPQTPFQPSMEPGQAAPGSQAPAPPGQAPAPPELIPQWPEDPSTQPAINPVSIPGGKPQTPLNPVQNPGGTFSSVGSDNLSVMSAEQFANGDMVVNKNEEWGVAVGLNGGEQVAIPKNSRGEVLGTDPTGMVNVYFAGPMGERGNLEPHGVTAWFFPGELVARPDIRPPGPAIRRR
jgi:hypothetical protein